MARKQPQEEWAATALLPSPPRWGEIETQLLKQADKPRPGLAHYLGLSVVLLLAVSLYGAPWFGLASVLAFAQTGADGWWFVSFLAFGAASLLPLITLGIWHSTRRRQVWDLFLTGGTAVAALAALLLLNAVIDLGEAGMVGLLMLAATVTGLVIFVVILVASKPGRRKTVPFGIRMRTLISPVNELHYVRARERGRQLLVKHRRIQVDEDTQQKLDETPLGFWHELD